MPDPIGHLIKYSSPQWIRSVAESFSITLTKEWPSYCQSMLKNGIKPLNGAYFDNKIRVSLSNSYSS